MQPTNIPIPINSRNTCAIEFSSLLHLRWGAIGGQILLIIILDLYLQTKIPYSIVTAIIFFETASNILFHHQKSRRHKIPVWLFAVIMFVDVALLTVLLFQTGGAMNPFTFLYLLHIVIGAILMPPLWAWSLAVFTIFCYTSLFLPAFNPTLPILTTPKENSNQVICLDSLQQSKDNAVKIKLHLQGMLVAFAITSLFIVYFIGRIRKTLAGHNKMLVQLKEQKARNEQLAALATLAAGTAHEISTPLSTIKVATGEMLYNLKNQYLPQDLEDDIMLIRGQIGRCEDVLYQMSEDAGEHRGENFKEFTIKQLFEEAIAMLPNSQQQLIAVDLEDGNTLLYGPLQTFKRTIKGMIRNSIDACSNRNTPTIWLREWQEGGLINFSVKDQGEGMDSRTLHRATEPFFTSKSTGQGMGLGLFLAKSVAERFGGELSISSSLNGGTEVVFSIATDKILKEGRI